MEDRKTNTESEKYYFLIVPVYEDKAAARAAGLSVREGVSQFVITFALAESSLEKAIAFHKQFQRCDEKAIQVERILIPLEKFNELHEKFFYGASQVLAKAKEAFLEEFVKENGKYKMKSLQDIVSEEIVKQPAFFDKNKEILTEQAKEKVKEASERLTPKGKGS